MQTPANFSVRLLIYWISGILLSDYYSPSIFIVLIAICSWLLSTQYTSVYLEEFAMGCFIAILSAYLTLTFHSKEEITAGKPLIIIIESFEGHTREHLRYNARWSGGDFKVYSKDPIDQSYYLIKELPKKGFNDQLVLFVNHNKLANWQKLTEKGFHFPIRWVFHFEIVHRNNGKRWDFHPFL